MGLADRGQLALWLLADLNVIDLERLRLDMPRIVYDLPDGGRRLTQRVWSYDLTLKSGKITYRDGEHQDRYPGELVRM